jgi:hypothetical protein
MISTSVAIPKDNRPGSAANPRSARVCPNEPGDLCADAAIGLLLRFAVCLELTLAHA